MTDYEIIKAEPQQLQLQVKYTKTDCPHYWLNFRIDDFSESNMHSVAQDGAGRANEFWDSINALPESITPIASSGTAKERVYTDAPSFDKFSQEATFIWVESDDALTQTWTVTEKSDEDKAESIRAQRNVLLRDTDYNALSDVTMSAEMTAYRQALRDIPQQTDFPTTVTWPTKP